MRGFRGRRGALKQILRQAQYFRGSRVEPFRHVSGILTNGGDEREFGGTVYGVQLSWYFLGGWL